MLTVNAISIRWRREVKAFLSCFFVCLLLFLFACLLLCLFVCLFFFSWIAISLRAIDHDFYNHVKWNEKRTFLNSSLALILIMLSIILESCNYVINNAYPWKVILSILLHWSSVQRNNSFAAFGKKKISRAMAKMTTRAMLSLFSEFEWKISCYKICRFYVTWMVKRPFCFPCSVI